MCSQGNSRNSPHGLVGVGLIVDHHRSGGLQWGRGNGLLTSSADFRVLEEVGKLVGAWENLEHKKLPAVERDKITGGSHCPVDAYGCIAWIYALNVIKRATWQCYAYRAICLPQESRIGKSQDPFRSDSE